jgi:hypothetical protein
MITDGGENESRGKLVAAQRRSVRLGDYLCVCVAGRSQVIIGLALSVREC